MKSLYVTSVEPRTGKTAVCLALGKRFQSDGHKVGYLKPLSTQPWRAPDGSLTDEDAALAKAVLSLAAKPADLVPVIVTASSLRERLKGVGEQDLPGVIRRAAQEAGKGKDILLLEGGDSLREGHAMGLSNLELAHQLGAPALVLVRYRGEMTVLDDALTARFRLEDELLGVILNRVPDAAQPFITEFARPYLEGQGIRILGCMPDTPRLAALSVGETIHLLNAEVLTKDVNPNALIESFSVGAMSADAALTSFRRQANKAVITGGDRSDILLAALETSTVALILSGGLRPSRLIIQQAEALGVAILVAEGNTIEGVSAIDQGLGRARLAGPEKLECFSRLMAEHVDTAAIFGALGLR